MVADWHKILGNWSHIAYYPYLCIIIYYYYKRMHGSH